MRMWRAVSTAVLAVGLAGVMAAPAQAAPAPAKACVLDITSGAVSCRASVGEIDRLVTAKRATNLVRFWDGLNMTGASLTVSGPVCSATTTDIDLPFTSLFPLEQQVGSVTKFAAGHCNWQLRGAAGATSTWVEGSWPDLRNLGDGWNNRAVDFRLT